MENIKVKVNNEAESREVQGLFFELDLGWHFGDVKYLKNLDMPYLYAFAGSKEITCSYIKSSFINHENKEITIQQLRDMVVLKRNSINDATHINFRTNTPFLVQGSKEYFYLNNKWILSDSVNDLKPIEKKEMKEFLVKYDDKWTLQLLDSDTEENSYRVAVPSGAEILIALNKRITGFYKNDFGLTWIDDGWVETKNEYSNWVKYPVLWQRSETEYLMQGENGDKLTDSIAQLNSKDTIKVTIDELKHRVYKKDVSHLDSIDVYRVLELFNVQSHAVGHAIKKLLCSGGRGAKDEAQDIQEAIDSLIRYQEMKNEDE